MGEYGKGLWHASIGLKSDVRTAQAQKQQVYQAGYAKDGVMINGDPCETALHMLRRIGMYGIHGSLPSAGQWTEYSCMERVATLMQAVVIWMA